jgi:hypothetical protein
MKLTYRGVSYESNPSNLELIEQEIGGKYRGATWKQKYLRHIPVSQPKIDLKYRGIAYCTGDPIDVEASLLRRNYNEAANSTAIPTTTEAELTPSSRQQLLEELNHIHLNNICRNLEHRLQVARAKGDQNLIQLLEAEAKQLGSCSSLL